MNQNQQDYLKAKIIEFGTPLAIEYFARIAKTNPDGRGILIYILRDQLESDFNLMQENAELIRTINKNNSDAGWSKETITV